MTSRSTPLSERTPFLLKPCGKDYLWGGRRLNDDFAKGIDMEPLAETWECSTHPDGPSTVASGPFAGQLLTQVLKNRPDLLGTHCGDSGELPILIKLIDAKQDLSVQVHPDDGFAGEHENGQRGKTEFWYVLDAAKDAQMVYGLRRDRTAEELRESIESGTLERCLQRVSVQPDDVFYIEAGTIHAIGAGCLIAEIQQNSDLTYRLYDYDRVDKRGNRRELHIDKALLAAKLRSSAQPRQPLRVLNYRPGAASELLARCEYFQISRLLLNTERIRTPVPYQTDELSFRALLCIRGCGCVFYEEKGANTALRICKGDCVFVPADSVPMGIHGRMELLEVGG